VGIPYVLVNGVPVVDGGEHTQATPGRVLRRGPDGIR
jgi:N-acyl-D-amino-acid deacylase